MSLKEYAPVPLEDVREDEPEDLSPLGYYSRVRRRGSSTVLRRSIYFLLAQLLISTIAVFVSVFLFQKFWRPSCVGDGLNSHSQNTTPVDRTKLTKL
jgi:hypothetical protein